MKEETCLEALSFPQPWLCCPQLPRQSTQPLEFPVAIEHSAPFCLTLALVLPGILAGVLNCSISDAKHPAKKTHPKTAKCPNHGLQSLWFLSCVAILCVERIHIPP